MAIEWNDRLAIDKGIIDQDHRVLIDLCSTFIRLKESAGKAELARVIADLEHYARSHFWRESELQRRIGFCYAEQQTDEHRQLVASLGEVAVRFFHAKEAEAVRAVSNELGKLLHSWLIDHILKSDIHMVAYRTEIAAMAKDMTPMDGADKGAAVRTIGSDVLYNLSIDNGVIDDDHHHLIELINDFILGTSEAVGHAYLDATLIKLQAYTQSHFSREEDLQAAVGFPFAVAHKQAHQSLIASLGGFQAQLSR
ncbi:Hemerythrin [Paramagnetospirillum magnetotacticum MS-1]|uniref:Hemerythrin n=1 Tax=Paramagnetospirillum magnetotacticum MS-1 TaxID=272627 RepID=A0A0C2V630_PARME|nr:hemerythrin domain-containing protein [Paramagnetospirillum magnetotacticum]KIM00527.1 Hemerythrin [Paramagnetospirillum magnetotacticum MS-1]